MRRDIADGECDTNLLEDQSLVGNDRHRSGEIIVTGTIPVGMAAISRWSPSAAHHWTTVPCGLRLHPGRMLAAFAVEARTVRL